MTVLVVTGTGTGVGKTVVTSAIAALTVDTGRRVAVLKIAQTGVDVGQPGDIDEVRRLAGPAVTCRELARYPDPLAPATAARRAGLPPVTPVIATAAANELALDHDLVLIEGAGGLLVQLDDGGGTLADVAVALAAPVLVVAAAGLGTLNHTALTAEVLRTRRLGCVGIVIGAWPAKPDLAARCNLADLPAITGWPLLGALPAGAGCLTAGEFLPIARRGLEALFMRACNWDAACVDPLRVFISSTSVDLLEYRQAAHDALMGLDHHPVDMIYWSADPQSGTTRSVDRVRQADVLILLLAHRYGHVPDGADHSVTEQEYRAARDADIPVLAFFLDPAAPWPPDHVEWEAKERLAAFKALVESEVTKKMFRTPQELATQVVQSLALLTRQPNIRTPARRFRGRGIPKVSLPVRLLSEPDLLVPIGTAEDGLPLLLDVRRSHDLSGLFAQLADAVVSTNRTAPQALLDTFRQSLEEFGNQSWAADRIMPVVCRTAVSRRRRRLYVSAFTLTGPFTSILASIFEAPAVSWRAARRWRTPGPTPVRGALETVSRPVTFGVRAELQSSGGRNRFLAVSPEDGTTYSVGRDQAGDMVEWRPFVCESVLKTFPEAAFSLLAGRIPLHGPLAQAPDLLMRRLADHRRDGYGRFDVRMRVEVQAQAAVRVVGAVARELAAVHDAGMVHGDIKPQNVLLTDQGVMLIDSFDVEFEQPSPGWTPNWSPPEQVLGLPLTSAADVYPLAVMVGTILGGELVGEVRKYHMPDHMTGQNEFDVFHNPSLFVDSDTARVSAAGVRAWRRFVERGLRFDPDQRPASVLEFAAEIDELAVEHPLSGVLSFEPSGSLSAARLVDGTDAIARVITDCSSVPVPGGMTRPSDVGLLPGQPVNKNYP